MSNNLCSHCGETCQLCEYWCPICGSAYVGCPDTEEIRRLCEAIREDWPQCRFDKCEGYEECEVPTAHRVTDHMRRKPEEGD